MPAYRISLKLAEPTAQNYFLDKSISLRDQETSILTAHISTEKSYIRYKFVIHYLIGGTSKTLSVDNKGKLFELTSERCGSAPGMMSYAKGYELNDDFSASPVENPRSWPDRGCTVPEGGSPATSGSVGQGKAPVLGQIWGSGGQVGYGQSRPSTISNGGDPTGLVTHIKWSSWGSARAIGTGISDYTGLSQSVAAGTEEAVTVVAFRLGTCHGRPSYLAVEWYFAKRGEKFKPGTYINPCTGEYVRS